MRRKQLYAMILAGALATGGVPVTAIAADAASETAGEETGDFGFEFGYGAEIGISTQKLHARGPMGLLALTTTKYIIYGNGQIRP